MRRGEWVGLQEGPFGLCTEKVGKGGKWRRPSQACPEETEAMGEEVGAEVTGPSWNLLNSTPFLWPGPLIKGQTCSSRPGVSFQLR